MTEYTKEQMFHMMPLLRFEDWELGLDFVWRKRDTPEWIEYMAELRLP